MGELCIQLLLRSGPLCSSQPLLSLLRYAVGITLLICLTNRHAVVKEVGIFDACEAEHDEDFEEMAATKLADPTSRFPPAVAAALKELVKSKDAKCLCHDKARKRLDLPSVLEALQEMLRATAGPADDAPPPAAASSESTAPSQPTPTMLVNKIGKDAAANPKQEAERRLQRHAVNGFNAFMSLLERSYGATTPDLSEFEKVRCAFTPQTSAACLNHHWVPLLWQLEYWHHQQSMPASLHSQLQRLRVWRNAAEHRDAQRWRSEGPKSDAEFNDVVERIKVGVQNLSF